MICGKQAIDNDCNQSGQMLSALLGWPQGCFISSLDLEDKHIRVRCETDDGLETLQLTLPCVLTTDLRLNEPRFAKLPDIIKAKQKPLEHIALDSLPIKIRAHQEIIEYMPPSTRPPGQQLDNVDELIAILKKNEVLT